LKEQSEAVPIVQGQVVVEILSLGNEQSFLFRNPLKRSHVDGIIICKDPIEIEDQRANHQAGSVTQVEWSYA
jgi:hypothetical protein